jgi:hypothetical protein
MFACICDFKFCAYVLCIWFEIFMHLKQIFQDLGHHLSSYSITFQFQTTSNDGGDYEQFVIMF